MGALQRQLELYEQSLDTGKHFVIYITEIEFVCLLTSKANCTFEASKIDSTYVVDHMKFETFVTYLITLTEDIIFLLCHSKTSQGISIWTNYSEVRGLLETILYKMLQWC